MPSSDVPTMVANKEVPVGRIEVASGVYRTLYFMRYNATIGNVQEQAYDPTYPNGAPSQIVRAELRLSNGAFLPWGTSTGNYIRWAATTTSTRMISQKDSAGSWAGTPATLYLWYYKSS